MVWDLCLGHEAGGGLCCFKHSLVGRFTYWITFPFIHLSSECKDNSKTDHEETFITKCFAYLYWDRTLNSILENPLKNLVPFEHCWFFFPVSPCNKPLNMNLSTWLTVSSLVKCMEENKREMTVNVIQFRMQDPWGQETCHVHCSICRTKNSCWMSEC